MNFVKNQSLRYPSNYQTHITLKALKLASAECDNFFCENFKMHSTTEKGLQQSELCFLIF